MKNTIKKLFAASFLLLLSGLLTSTWAHNAIIQENVLPTKSFFGGAYLLFANKLGGEVNTEDLACHTELQVEGCARGSKIYQFTLRVTKDGKTRSYKNKSFRLTEEMIAELKNLSAGDAFEFREVKAYLPNGRDSVDVFCKKFRVV